MTTNCQAPESSDDFDYSRFIYLDAEALCESGIGEAYSLIVPPLSEYVEPLKLTEIKSEQNSRYFVDIGQNRYSVYDLDNSTAEKSECWAIATYTIFDAVNSQLADFKSGFYAVYGGNDLQGVFMTKDEVLSYRAKHSAREWPYVPTNEKPNYGFPREQDDLAFGLN